ncbi:MAG: ATP-dependent Clp protease ATP-binding subunit [Patescibacteria group bacterium]|nr:ATP-dependent Clp protease ATP-binding subunit [Patescibacteria group bacterium]
MANFDIFKRFGESAKKVLFSAQKFADSQHAGIGPEHLLVALIATPNTLSWEILKDYEIHLDQVKLVINFNNFHTNHPKGISPSLRNILALAAKKVVELKQTSIEAEHLLWAILSKPDNIAYQIIIRLGGNPNLIKEELEESFIQDLPPQGFSPQNLPPELFPFLGNLLENQIPAQNKTQSNSPTPFLDEFGLDLTKNAKAGELDPIIGRENEIKRAIQILCRRTKNNPVLVGDPGVGKTAIVEGIAQKIIANQVPALLKNKKIISLDLAILVAGTMYRGQFEERLKKLIQEINKYDDVILFIDELHTVVGTGNAEGSMDAANILKPQLAKGKLRLIGATTSEEYRKYIEKDSALERRLQKIEVSEPTLKETIEILNGIKSKYEKHHNVKITSEAISAAANLAKRYISDRFLPDKAIDLIDEAASATYLDRNISEESQNSLEHKYLELKNIIKNKEKEIDSQNFEQAAILRSQELQIKKEIEALESKLAKNETVVIDYPQIAKVVSLWTKIPLENLIQSEKGKFSNIEALLSKYIIGQKEAIQSISESIKRAKAGVSNPNRPLGVFMFLGPTGVGKTELSKVLARTIFDSENNLIKIDMSEFMEKHNISRLIGAPPGYVGFEEAGKLTESVRRKPYSVILFDEIEKAHPEVFNILLQIMEDGYLTDSKGKKVNFKNTIIIMTSNIGIKELSEQAAIGFKNEEQSEQKQFQREYEKIKSRVLGQYKNHFRPEFLNRVDKTIVFKPLQKQDLHKITTLQIQQLRNRLLEQNIKLLVNKAVIDFVVDHGFDPTLGARPIRRAITEFLENPLADKILSGEIKAHQTTKAIIKNNKVTFIKQSKRDK